MAAKTYLALVTGIEGGTGRRLPKSSTSRSTNSAHGPARLLSTLQGTLAYGFSTGNTLPITAMPFGMVHWSPQTSDGAWFFDPRERKLQGVRATDQPSPWIGDYGWFLISSQTGERGLSMRQRAAARSHEPDHFKPHRFRCQILKDQSHIQVIPTERGALFLFDFFGEPGRVIVQAGDKGSWVRVLPEEGKFEGVSRTSTGGAPDGFGCYFVGVVSQTVRSHCIFEGLETFERGEEHAGLAVGLALEFNFTEPEGKLSDGSSFDLTLRVATSFISIEQAWVNLYSELAGHTPQELLDASTSAWRNELGKFEVESDSVDTLKTFYSCLYRTLLFPRTFHEPKPGGGIHHYSPFDGQIHDGPSVTDNGFWDTYRTVYPLFALVSPSRLSTILSGWINAYGEGGWFPQWASPGYRACMVGTHIDAVFADAVVKGVTGFDLETAYEGLRKHAFEPGDTLGAYGRLGIESYLSKGYVPDEEHLGSVARSLDYAYNDFCLSQIASALGKQEDARMFRQRALNYRHLYDREVGFMRGRSADGSWAEPWKEFCWGGGYVEGGPWQSTWAVPHDPAGLIQLMGGDSAFVQKLRSMIEVPPHFEVGTYRFEIHEMTEMACAGFGQYAHSNQPVHHVLYLFAAAGEPWLTQRWVSSVMARLYSPENLLGRGQRRDERLVRPERDGLLSALPWTFFVRIRHAPIQARDDETRRLAGSGDRGRG